MSQEDQLIIKMGKKKRLKDRRIRGLPIDKPKTFIENYPEFKDLISYDEECETEFVAVGLIESVLDKHFERKTECERLMRVVEQVTGKNINDFIEEKMIEKQKVKDAIFKNFEMCSHNVHYERVKPLLKELGLE